MSEPLHDIDKLFADNIESYSEKPPADVWDKIDAGLDKKSADIFRKKYQSLRKVAAILLFLFLGAVAYEMISHFNNNQEAENTNKHSVSNSGTNKESVTSTNNTNNQTKKGKTNPGNISVSPVDSTNSVNIQPGETVKAEITTTTSAQSVDENNKVIKSVNNQGTDNVTTIPSGKKNKKPNKVVITTANAAIAESFEKNNRNNNLSLKRANSNYKMEVTQARIDHNGRNEADNNAAVITDQPADTKRIILPESLLVNTYDRVLTTTVFVNEKLKDVSSQFEASALSFKKPGQDLNRNIHSKSLMFFAMPNIAWNNLDDDKPHPIGGGREEDHREIEKNEHRQYAYTAGLKFNYNFSNNWTLQTGINYQTSVTSIKPKYVFADRDNFGDIRYRLDCSSGYSYLLPKNMPAPNTGDSLEVENSKNRVSYIGVPLAIEYNKSFGRFSIGINSGFQMNVLLNSKTSAVFSTSPSSVKSQVSAPTEGLKHTYFSFISGISGEMRLTKKLSFVINPTGQFGLSSINSGASVKTITNYFGIGAGLKLKL